MAIMAALFGLPVAAVALYLTVGHPQLPAQPLAPAPCGAQAGRPPQ
ncbi:hypothetical protein RAA17_20975 [Komagataeibacter rhaeticus]|nr:hypothetical protein [Komagataeibacter rhaeticus]